MNIPQTKEGGMHVLQQSLEMNEQEFSHILRRPEFV